MENNNDLQPDETSSDAAAAAQEQDPAETSASFNERFVAYAIDTFPFVLAATFSLSLLVRKGLLPSDRGTGIKWKLLWIAVYIAYETAFSSGGRATLGKYLLGLRVRAADGSDLSAPKAFLRAMSYFISSAALNTGYLLALFTPRRRALHDYISGSTVVSTRTRGPMAEILIVALSWACIALLAVSWVQKNFMRLSPEDKRLVAAAQLTVTKVGKLEDIYRGMYGGYTEDLKRLAALTGNPSAVRNEIMKTLAPETLTLSTDGRVYIITANARDRRKTKVTAVSLPPVQAK